MDVKGLTDILHCESLEVSSLVLAENEPINRIVSPEDSPGNVLRKTPTSPGMRCCTHYLVKVENSQLLAIWTVHNTINCRSIPVFTTLYYQLYAKNICFTSFTSLVVVHHPWSVWRNFSLWLRQRCNVQRLTWNSWASQTSELTNHLANSWLPKSHLKIQLTVKSVTLCSRPTWTTVCDASDLKQQTAKTNVNQSINIYLSPCNIQKCEDSK